MTINVRQVCFILFMYTVTSRLLQYPTMLANYSGNDLIISALVDFAVQGIVIWALAYLSSKTNKTFFELIEDTLGTICAKIIYGFFAAFFLLATILPLFEQKLYVHAIFYDTLPALPVFLPILFFTVYAGSKAFKNIGRSADICLPIFIVSLVLIFAMSFTEVDFSNLLPIGVNGAENIFGGSLKTSFRFIEPAYLLFFLGKFRYKKWDAARITVSYVLGSLVMLFFLAVFYGIYADLTASRQFAVSKMSLYFSAIDIIGRIDLLVLYALEIVMLFALVLNIQLAVHCLVKCTGWHEPEWLSLIVNAVLATILLTCDHFYSDIQSVFANWMWIPFILFATVIPLCAWTLKRRHS